MSGPDLIGTRRISPSVADAFSAAVLDALDRFQKDGAA